MTTPDLCDDFAALLSEVAASSYAAGAAMAIGGAVALFPPFLRPLVQRRLLTIVNSRQGGTLLVEQFHRALNT